MRIQAQLKVRTLQDIEANAQVCVQLFEDGLVPVLEELTPILTQVFYDFKHKKPHELIMGCGDQDTWARTYLKRTARAIHYLLGSDEAKEQRRLVERNRRLAEKTKQNTCSVEPSQAFESGNSVEQPIAVELKAKVLEIEEPVVLSDERYTALEDKLHVQSFELQKAQADFKNRQQWVRELQLLTRELIPEGQRNVFMTAEQREKWEKLIEAEP